MEYPTVSIATKINKAQREFKHDISRQHDKDEVGLGVIFNELWDKMTASKHKKKWYTYMYRGPSHRKLYRKVIRLKQARTRRRLVPPYQAYGFSTGKNCIQSLWTNVERSGIRRENLGISNSFPSFFQTFKSTSFKPQYSISILLSL